jgi:hypothetical protein
MYKFSKWFLDLDLRICDINLSINPNPGAIQFLKSNPQYINWNFISTNPAATDLIYTNLDKIKT